MLSESINNPLRMLGGLVHDRHAGLPPGVAARQLLDGRAATSWRSSATPSTATSTIPARAAAYRKSFSYYTLQRLLVSIVFYASAAMLFLGAFVMRYRLELILAFPLIALVMAIYLGLAFKPESAVVNPEKLYREPVLMVAVVACAVALIVLMVVDIPRARHDLQADRPADPRLTSPATRMGRETTLGARGPPAGRGDVRHQPSPAGGARPVLLTVSGEIPADLDAQVARRAPSPRADYRLLGAAFDADLLDVARARAAAGAASGAPSSGSAGPGS